MSKQNSPVGDPVTKTIHRKAQKSAAYRAKRAELEPYERIARVVIMRRAELGMSQEELAGKMQTTASAISRIERGQHKTRPETLKKLAEALGGHAVVGFVFDDQPQQAAELIAL
jgi:ribosome-binding protein aMBF1 (putative translation factor)